MKSWQSDIHDCISGLHQACEMYDKVKARSFHLHSLIQYPLREEISYLFQGYVESEISLLVFATVVCSLFDTVVQSDQIRPHWVLPTQAFVLDLVIESWAIPFLHLLERPAKGLQIRLD